MANYQTITAEFKGGVFTKPCKKFPDIAVGAVNCTGHPKINIPKCEYCHSFTENNSYELKIIGEVIPIVDAVNCMYFEKQLNLF